MGTRATIRFKVGEKTLLTVYHQYDGYIKNGLGNELGSYLNDFKLVSMPD